MAGKKKEAKKSPLEEGMITAMRALDKQIARRMERGPAEREESGVQKWGPYEDKIEEVCALVMNALGENEVDLDSLVVLSQAFTKSLYLVSEDLGEEGLGKVRSNYCQRAFENIARDALRGETVLKGSVELM